MISSGSLLKLYTPFRDPSAKSDESSISAGRMSGLADRLIRFILKPLRRWSNQFISVIEIYPPKVSKSFPESSAIIFAPKR